MLEVWIYILGRYHISIIVQCKNACLPSRCCPDPKCRTSGHIIIAARLTLSGLNSEQEHFFKTYKSNQNVFFFHTISSVPGSLHCSTTCILNQPASRTTYILITWPRHAALAAPQQQRVERHVSPGTCTCLSNVHVLRAKRHLSATVPRTDGRTDVTTVGFYRPLALSGATSISATSLTGPQSEQPSLGHIRQTAFKAGLGDNPSGAPYG